MYQSIDKELSRNDDDYILNVCEEQYVSYLTEKYTLAPISIVKDSEEVHEPEEFREELNRYNTYSAFARYGGYRTGYRIKISYSFTGDSGLFNVRPYPWTMSSYDIIVDSVNNRVSFTIQIYSQDVSEFEREKASAYNSAFANVDNMKRCVTSFNSDLKEIISRKFKMEKDKRKSKNNFFSAIKGVTSKTVCFKVDR